MSRYYELEEAHRIALREEAQQRALNLEHRLDALISGMTTEEYAEYLIEVGEGVLLDARVDAEKYGDAVRISQRNRGEKP